MFSRTMVRAIIGTLAIGVLACSERGSTLVQPDDASTSRTSSGVSITVTIDSTSIAVGRTARAIATLRDSHGAIITGKTVTWSSTNAAVASVSSSGIVSGVSGGTAVISAAYQSARGSASITVTNAPVVASISVSLANSTILAGATTTATATLRDASGAVITGRTVTWSSGNPAVGTVSASGEVTGIAAGTAAIIATCDGVSSHLSITVTSASVAPVASVSVSIPTSALVPGQTTQAVATLRDAAGTVLTGRTIVWSSSAPGIASVSSTGLVTGIATGAATISATSEGVTGSAPVTVGSSLIRSITFDGYASTSALLADCTAFDCVEQNLTDNAGVPGFAAGDVTLDATAAPPGGTKAMRYHYIHPGDGCNSITLKRSIRFPARQEVWAEFVVKWSTSFTTQNDLCQPNDHKFLFGDTQAAANRRWALYIGSDVGPWHSIMQEIPTSPDVVAGNYYLNKNSGSGALFAEQLWDGRWHTIRVHMKASSTSTTRDGAYQVWIDGVLRHDASGFAIDRNDGTTAGDLIDGFSFAHNKDDGPPGVDMDLWWGVIRVFGANPGW